MEQVVLQELREISKEMRAKLKTAKQELSPQGRQNAGTYISRIDAVADKLGIPRTS